MRTYQTELDLAGPAAPAEVISTAGNEIVQRAAVTGKSERVTEDFAGAPNGASPAFYPSDTLVPSQWHLSFIGNLERVWDEFTGVGINVGVYDDGVQYIHPDLDDRYSTALHIVFNGTTFDGREVVQNNVRDPHGTAVAGLINAANNGVGTVGVAFNSMVTGVNIFNAASALFINSGTPTGFMSAIADSKKFDIVNNSWGSQPSFLAAQNLNVSNSFAKVTNDNWKVAIDTGRGGLGTIVVKASGNDSRNANGEGLNASRYTITVAAVSNNALAASYSNHGVNTLVTAPGSEFAGNQNGLGILTTDLLGVDGYNNRGSSTSASDTTNDFGGTSAATPIVSGVIALMLDANPNLGWRDVQDILARSATLTGSLVGATVPGQFENGNWVLTNGGQTWNNGGMHFHTNYGYGIVDAFAAARMAEVWNLFGPAQTSANESSVTFNSGALNVAIPDSNFVTFSFAIASPLQIEHLALTMTLQHTFFTDLIITLIAPDGSRHVVADRGAGSGTTSDLAFTWTYGVDSLRGLSAVGTWTVEIRDAAAADIGTLQNVSATFYGRSASTNTVYHFTDEFGLMAYLDPSRRLVEDVDGGIDWLNMAAMSGDLVVNLNNLAYSSENGRQFVRIANLTVIENVVTGDGDDVLIGNDFNNELRGMRGDDSVSGGAGNDKLFGGAGNDLLFGGDGEDELDGGDGRDSLDGGEGNDNLFGGMGDDDVRGFGGNDLLAGGLGADRLIGDGGIDTVDYSGNFGAVLVNLATNLGQSNFAEGDIYSEVENARGTEFNDVLLGSSVANVISGNGGDDLIKGEAGADTLNGGAGLHDTVSYENNFGGIRIDLAAGTGQFNFADGDVLSGFEHVIGTEFADGLFGDGANNRLDARNGADQLQGRGGNDVLIGGLGADVLDGGADVDTADYSGNFGAIWIDLIAGVGRFNFAEGDTLIGIEKVIGTDFNDRFDSNSSTNFFTGGAGDDLFVFQANFSQDFIMDFAGNGAAAGDTIRFGAGTFSSFAQVMAAATQQGSDVVIALNAFNTLTLTNVTLAQLDSSDFLFG